MRRTELSRYGMSRRSFLTAAGAAGTSIALAGCLSAASGGDGPSTDDPSTDDPSTDDADGSDAEPDDSSTNTSDDDPEPALPQTGPPAFVDLEERDGAVTLRTIHARHAIKASDDMGSPIELPEVWAWAADGGTPSVPAPTLRAVEGQELSIELDNTESIQAHTFHVHGLRKDWVDDGTSETSGVTVNPGETHTYELTANVPGTHLYHCHFQTPYHMEMGMYGLLRVDPEGYEPADHEIFATVREWDTRLSRQYGGEDVSFDLEDRRPDAYTINGKSAPDALHPEEGTPIVVDEGDTVRVHFANAGFQSHAMHPHNHRFRVVEHDGSPLPEDLQYDRDVVTIGPAERYTIEFEADADPGIYPFHCHKVDHVRNGSTYPGGMLTAIVYEEKMSDDIFGDLMEAAGHEM